MSRPRDMPLAITHMCRHNIQIPYLDKKITVPSWALVLLMAGLDRAMYIATKGVAFDHAAHLGGLAFGCLYGLYLRKAASETVAIEDARGHFTTVSIENMDGSPSVDS